MLAKLRVPCPAKQLVLREAARKERLDTLLHRSVEVPQWKSHKTPKFAHNDSAWSCRAHSVETESKDVCAGNMMSDAQSHCVAVWSVSAASSAVASKHKVDSVLRPRYCASY